MRVKGFDACLFGGFVIFRKSLLGVENGTLLDEKVLKDSENVGYAVGTLDLSWKGFEKLSYLVIV